MKNVPIFDCHVRFCSEIGRIFLILYVQLYLMSFVRYFVIVKEAFGQK